jgi:putative flippase GtrA
VNPLRPRTLTGQPLRYAIAGAATALTYFALTLLLSGPLGVPIEVAIPCAYVPALLLHFTLQRHFVFRSHDGFALATHHQAGRYLTIGAAQVATTALITAFVPDLLGVDERIVYVLSTLAVAGLAFLMLRLHVFHAPGGADPSPASVRPVEPGDDVRSPPLSLPPLDH